MTIGFLLVAASISQSPRPYFSELDGSYRRKVEWECSERTASRIIDSACKSVYQDDLGWGKSPTINSIVERLVLHAVAALAEYQKSPDSRFLYETVLANCISAFCLRHLSYDSDTAQKAESNPGMFGHLTVELGLPEVVLKTRKGVCYGFARFEREIARAAGLRCVMTGGFYRGVKANQTVGLPNHMWVTYILPGDVWAPSDTSGFQGFVPSDLKPGSPWKVGGKIGEHFLVSLEPAAREVFHTMHFAWDRVESRDGDLQRVYVPHGITKAVWEDIGTSRPDVPKMAFDFFLSYQSRDQKQARQGLRDSPGT